MPGRKPHMPKPGEPTTHTNVVLDSDMYRGLAYQTFKTGESMGSLLTRCISIGMRSLKIPPKKESDL